MMKNIPIFDDAIDSRYPINAVRRDRWSGVQLACLFALAGCAQPIGFPPGLEARVYAPSPSLREADRFDQYSAFSADGLEYYLSVADADWNYRGILRSVRRGGVWIPFEPLPFVWGEGKDGGEPFITSDDQQLFFVSARAGTAPDETGMAGSAAIVQSGETDIYLARRHGKGWGEPERLGPPVNSRSSEWHPTLSDDGTLYFASERGRTDGKADIYLARRLAPGEFATPERLPAPINLDTSNDSDPFIAPDSSYLVFHSDRAGGFGAHDLYVSFRQGDGGWSDPRNMGSGVNSPGWEMGPSVTRDGRLLLFTRRADIHTSEPSRIYAVPAAILDQLRP